MTWLDLASDIASEFAELQVLDVRESGLSVRKSRAAIEHDRKAYKAAWALRKYRRDATFRALKIAADCARYHLKKELS